jgi:prepilin-type N-terminal cleavage/methylation domain-containing protein
MKQQSNGFTMSERSESKGFTLVEIVVVIMVIGVLATLVYSLIIPHWRERAYYSRSLAELNTMANGLNLYVAKHNEYPADEARNIPGGIKEFIQSQQGNDTWPNAPYPGSVYDYENWPPDANGPEQTYQISIRFCDAGDDATCKAAAKKYLSNYVSDDVLNNWTSSSAMYYCIKGSCRSHQSQPLNYPGYCINCGNKSNIF